jgi:hypothetical protein
MIEQTSVRVCLRRLLPIVALCLSASSCALHWPWHHPHKPAPPQVLVVAVAADQGASIAQYWDRNTLKVDLTGVSGDGHATLQPIAPGWPIRLEFLVRPGSFGQLELLADQRVVFQVPAQGAELVLKLAPGVYNPKTPSITLQWSAAADSAH